MQLFSLHTSTHDICGINNGSSASSSDEVALSDLSEWSSTFPVSSNSSSAVKDEIDFIVDDILSKSSVICLICLVFVATPQTIYFDDFDANSAHNARPIGDVAAVINLRFRNLVYL